MHIEVTDIFCRIHGWSGHDNDTWIKFYQHFTVPIPDADKLYTVQLKKICMELMNRTFYNYTQFKDEAHRLIKYNRYHDKLWDWYLVKATKDVEATRFDTDIRKALSYLCYSKGTDSWTSLIKVSGGLYTFPTGLLPQVIDYCKSKKITYTLTDLRHINSNVKLYANQHTVNLRPYQKAALLQAINNKLEVCDWPRGIIQIPTGGGKTELAIALCQMQLGPTVFLVNRKELLHQTHERFSKAFAKPIGIIGDGVWQQEHVTIASVQTLWAALQRAENKLAALFIHPIQIIIDEAHGLAAGTGDSGINTMVEIASKFSFAACRWALTATPLMRDELSNALLTGVTGEVVFKISTEELIKQGYLTKPKIIFNRVNHVDSYEDPITKEELKKPPGTQWKELYDFAIVRNPRRNKIIANLVESVPTPAIVLVQRIDHVDYINRYLKDKLVLLHGKSSKDEREVAKDMLRKGLIKVLCVTTIFDEGVDIPELRAIIMAGGGKSNIKTLQRLGRGLRLAQGKDEVIIHEFADFNESSPGWIPMKHSRERMNLFKKEGFNVTVTK